MVINLELISKCKGKNVKGNEFLKTQDTNILVKFTMYVFSCFKVTSFGFQVCDE